MSNLKTTEGSSLEAKARDLYRVLSRGLLPTPLQYADFEELDDDPEHVSGRTFLRDGLNVMTPYAAILQVGRELHIDVVNKSGGTIYNGTPVALTIGGGAQRFAVTTYPNTDIRSLYTFGIATHDIEDNQNGVVTWFGLVRDLKTDTYPVNSALYLGPTRGSLQVGPPDWDRCRIFLGFVLVSHPTQGVIGCSVVNNRPRAFAYNADPYYSSNRPNPAVLGEWGWDSDEGKMIVYNGSAWVDTNGGAL